VSTEKKGGGRGRGGARRGGARRGGEGGGGGEFGYSKSYSVSGTGRAAI